MTLRPENKNLRKGNEPRCYSLPFSAPFLKISIRCNFMQFLMPEDRFPVSAVKKPSLVKLVKAEAAIFVIILILLTSLVFVIERF